MNRTGPRGAFRSGLLALALTGLMGVSPSYGQGTGGGGDAGVTTTENENGRDWGPLSVAFGQVVRELREEAGLTQERLGS